MRTLGFTTTSTTRNRKKVRLYVGVREAGEREEVNSFVPSSNKTLTGKGKYITSHTTLQIKNIKVSIGP